jgi:hypothetical protein
MSSTAKDDESSEEGSGEEYEEEEYTDEEGSEEQSEEGTGSEDDEEDEDEEPKLKYQRLGANVMDILKRDSASCMAVHDKFLVSNFLCLFVKTISLSTK